MPGRRYDARRHEERRRRGRRRYRAPMLPRRRPWQPPGGARCDTSPRHPCRRVSAARPSLDVVPFRRWFDDQTMGGGTRASQGTHHLRPCAECEKSGTRAMVSSRRQGEDASLAECGADTVSTPLCRTHDQRPTIVCRERAIALGFWLWLRLAVHPERVVPKGVTDRHQYLQCVARTVTTCHTLLMLPEPGQWRSRRLARRRERDAPIPLGRSVHIGAIDEHGHRAARGSYRLACQAMMLRLRQAGKARELRWHAPECHDISRAGDKGPERFCTCEREFTPHARSSCLGLDYNYPRKRCMAWSLSRIVTPTARAPLNWLQDRRGNQPY